MILCQDGPLRFDLGRSSRRRGTPGASERDDGALRSLDEAVEAHIRRALALSNGRIHGRGGAGELLGVNPNTLRGRMRKLGIPFKKETAS